MMKAKLTGGLLAAFCLFSFSGVATAWAQSADLSLTKVKNDIFPIAPGDTGIEYTLTVTNHGPDTATNVVLDEYYALDLVWEASTPFCTGGFPCNLGNILNGDSRVIVVTFTLPASYAPAIPIYNSAEVYAATDDPDFDNNFAEVYAEAAGVNCGNLEVSAGYAHTCARVSGNGKPAPDTLPDEVVECWGDNIDGQSAPVPSGAFAQVSAGQFHSCGVTAAGTIECWGNNDSGQSSPPPGSDFAKVSAGERHTCAIRSTDQSITCWGSALVNPAVLNAPTGQFTQVSVAYTHACALRTNGELACWGDNTSLTNQIVTNTPTGNDWAQVAADGQYACALRQNGTVTCWGFDALGETVAPGGVFTQITTGEQQACGLRAGGLAECWGGFNDNGELDEPLEAFDAIDSGGLHTCGLLSDGSILCWGLNYDFQSSPPARSNLCPLCGNAALEGAESCEATAPGSGIFPVCCSPVSCRPYRLTEKRACRAATGPCDAPETCNGQDFSFCPTDNGPLYDASHVCRPGIGGCDPAETCTLNTNQCPADLTIAIAGTVCRAAAAGCDQVETCTGSSSACPADLVLTAGAVCRVAASVCDIQETCSGSSASCPANAYVAGGTECRALAGICDIAESCTGSSAFCPADAFVSAATECRASVGVCDVAESCTGSSAACPGNSFVSSTITCRGAAGVCDAEEKCTGSTATCPGDGKLTAATTCRAAAGACDLAEVCPGNSNFCPGDTLVTAGIQCRSSAGVCDVAESCTGLAAACPDDLLVDAGTECRASAGFCDVAESCTGSDAACPVNAFVDSTVVCRGASDVCDREEKCTGSTAACPADTVRGSNIVCRGAADVCDAAEQCTGVSKACPADSKLTSSTTCRASAGVCDVSEVCDGVADACPVDDFVAPGTVCRGAVDGCDVAETCEGAAACPDNAFAGTEVGCDDGVFCNGPDKCNGSGSCTVHDAGDPCPRPIGGGNCDDYCNEASDLCNALAADGTTCNDSDVCSSGETCTAGTCSGGAPTVCNDDVLCTADRCDAVEGCVYEGEELPESACYVASRSTLQIRRNAEDSSKNALKWSWRKGEPVVAADLGDPTVDTDYALCIFDHRSGESRLAGSIVLPAGSAALWRTKEGQAQYGDKAALTAGIKQLKAKADSRPEKSGMSMSTVGSNLTLPTLFSPTEFFDIDSSVTVQMRNSIGACWTSDLTEASFDRNEAEGVKADTQ